MVRETKAKENYVVVLALKSVHLRNQQRTLKEPLKVSICVSSVERGSLDIVPILVCMSPRSIRGNNSNAISIRVEIVCMTFMTSEKKENRYLLTSRALKN